MECLENMKTVYPDENNVVLNENSAESKPYINRESKSDELTIKLYSCHNINMKFLLFVTPPSIYQFYRTKIIYILTNFGPNDHYSQLLVTFTLQQEQNPDDTAWVT